METMFGVYSSGTIVWYLQEYEDCAMFTGMERLFGVNRNGKVVWYL